MTEVTDEMVNLACEVYAEVYHDDDKDMGDAMRAGLKAALAATPAVSGEREAAIEECARVAETIWQTPSLYIKECAAAIRALAATPAEDSSNALTGAALGRWCHENPNLAALTIEGLRPAGKIRQ